jgi:hypothetical protein
MKKYKNIFQRIVSLFFCIWLCIMISAQKNALYDNLPVGKYAVGFKIVTVTDSSRVVKPLYNYFGEKEKGDRCRQVTMHIWYPAKENTGKGYIRFEDYCYSDVLKSTNEIVSNEARSQSITNVRASIERFFGKTTDENWTKVVSLKMLALKEAQPLGDQFPLLIGMLRPLSTTITNEMLASNGYIVAMVLGDNARWPAGFISDITDMQKGITYLTRTFKTNPDSIGTFGFSGSGFSQLLLAMNDPRIAAYSDIESALYGEAVSDILSSSDYYSLNKMRVPFLHIYGKELGKGDTKFADFLNKKYSLRYHVSLNQSGLHHWDVASEGRISTNILHNRGDLEPGAKASFEIANFYLLNFFNAILKKDRFSQKILDDKSSIGNYNDTLWTIQQYPALEPPPDKLQFEELIKRKGMDDALKLAQHLKKVDSTADFISENGLNHLAQIFQQKDKLKEGIILMQLATEFYPHTAWLWRNLAGMQEADGNMNGAIQSCEKVLYLLKDLEGTSQSFDDRIKRSAQETMKRLKK